MQIKRKLFKNYLVIIICKKLQNMNIKLNKINYSQHLNTGQVQFANGQFFNLNQNLKDTLMTAILFHSKKPDWYSSHVLKTIQFLNGKKR
jgi:hypothetical protein